MSDYPTSSPHSFSSVSLLTSHPVTRFVAMTRRLSFDRSDDSALFCTWARGRDEAQQHRHFRDRAASPPVLSFDEVELPPQPPTRHPLHFYRTHSKLLRIRDFRLALVPSPVPSLDGPSYEVTDPRVKSPLPKASLDSLCSITTLTSSVSDASSLGGLMSDLERSIASWSAESVVTEGGTRSLRKRKTPRLRSLRDIRKQQSELQLHLAYEKSLAEYLDQ